MNGPRRDHLFVSYATEDAVLAEWLALKLTAEGYRVWCDRFELLGGESYPQDIDRAIKKHTFRLLALISQSSKDKANPLKERTLALNLARERGEDFLIPLKVDDIKPTDLGWMLSDLTYIPFRGDWTSGFAQLLKKLKSIDAPRPLNSGKKAVCDWFAAREQPADQEERLWSNLVEFDAIPGELLNIRPRQPLKPGTHSLWPHFRQNNGELWAFELPPHSTALHGAQISRSEWPDRCWGRGLDLNYVATRLLNSHVRTHCLALGMRETPTHRHLYFPNGLLPRNRLQFETYGGRRTWLRVVGERTFRIASGREQARYHISPTFRVNLRTYGVPLVQVHVRVHLTDLKGKQLPAGKALRRRKKICKSWWNHHWLGRTIAVVRWMAGGAEVVNLAQSQDCEILLKGLPCAFRVPVGIVDDATAPGIREPLEELDDSVGEDQDAQE